MPLPTIISDTPLISVVMAVKDEELFIAEAIDSILKQNFTNFELLILDDGSIDKTCSIIKKFAAEDKRVVFLGKSGGIGLTKSLNLLIGKAKGQFIARQDGDDISAASRLSEQMVFFKKNPQMVLVGTGRTTIDSSGKFINNPAVIYRPKRIKSLLKHGNVFTHGSVMFRKRDFYAVGRYDERFKYSQDYDLWLRFSKVGGLLNIRKRLYKSRYSAESISEAKREEQTAYALMAIFKNEQPDLIEEKKLFDQFFLLSEDGGQQCINTIIDIVCSLDDKRMYALFGNALLRAGYPVYAHNLLNKSNIFDKSKYWISKNELLFGAAKKMFRLVINPLG